MPSPPPLPSNRAELDEHIAEFEAWFMKSQQAHGMEGASLMSVEHAILRSYIAWLKVRNVADQAQ